nr:hypothetical protein [Tanacetum cinerariifolium]
MTSSSKKNSPAFKRKTARMSVKYPTYVNLTSSSEEHPNERTPSPPPRKKSLSPPQAPSKSISSKSTHYISSSLPSESPTPTHVAPPPKLRFVILIKQEPQELPPLQMSPNNPYVSTMDNWPPSPSNPSLSPRVSRPPLGSPNLPPEFKPLPSTQPLFVNINNNILNLHNNAPPLENIHHPPSNLGNQDFPNPPNILDFFSSILYFAFVTNLLSIRQDKTCKERLHNTFCFEEKEEKNVNSSTKYLFSKGEKRCNTSLYFVIVKKREIVNTNILAKYLMIFMF